MTKILVTGGAKGVGAAIVRALAAAGHDVDFTFRSSAEQALADLEREMAAEIRRSLDEDPDLLPLYEARLAAQAEIDALRARGAKVPLSLISNPYHRRWYVFNGWADPEN